MDRPIIFYAPMIRALLDGRKTQTRRIIKPQPSEDIGLSLAENPVRFAPGDRLWVREARETETHFIPAFFMPRKDSRLTLIVSAVRVERIQDITADDVMSEGCPVPFETYDEGPPSWFGAHAWFRDLWISLHGPDAWQRNDWVAAVSFRVVKANIDVLPEAA
jgi:hypothetical protein